MKLFLGGFFMPQNLEFTILFNYLLKRLNKVVLCLKMRVYLFNENN